MKEESRDKLICLLLHGLVAPSILTLSMVYGCANLHTDSLDRPIRCKCPWSGVQRTPLRMGRYTEVRLQEHTEECIQLRQGVKSGN